MAKRKKKDDAKERAAKLERVRKQIAATPHPTMATDQFIPHPDNARVHTPEQIALIVGSILKVGFRRLPVAKSDGTTIAGHGSVLAALDLGLDRIPFTPADDMTDEEIQFYLIADNQIGARSTWDNQILIPRLGEMKLQGLDLESLGFERANLALFLGGIGTEGKTDPDAIPESAPARCKAGDLWQLGQHRLLCGDSTNVHHVERLMGGEKADMVFTDPPYGMNLNTDFSSMKSKFGPRSGKYAAVEGDSEPFNPALLIELFRDAREMFLWGADYYAERINDRLCGSWVVWDKRAGEGVSQEREESLSRTFGSGFELCWSRERHQRIVCRILWNGMFGMGKDDEQRRLHPTQKPVALAEWFFERWGKSGDLVADLFLGSGSTLIACEKTARRCFGMEIDAKYGDIIISRWESFTGAKAHKIPNKTATSKLA